MPRKKYEFFEHTADIGLKAFGKTPEEVFVNAAQGMFSIIASSRQIKPKEKITINLQWQTEDYAQLLRLWLQELLYHYSVREIVFTKFLIQNLSPAAITAVALGNKAAHKIKAEIKAVTYHELEFKKTKTGYQAKVIFDV